MIRIGACFWDENSNLFLEVDGHMTGNLYSCITGHGYINNEKCVTKIEDRRIFTEGYLLNLKRIDK